MFGQASFDGSQDITINTSLENNTIKTNLAINGNVIFKKKGNVVFVITTVTCGPTSAFILGENSAVIPDWALPSSNIVENDGPLKCNTVTDMDGKCRGYLILDKKNKKISTVISNTDMEESKTLTMSATYIVD